MQADPPNLDFNFWIFGESSNGVSVTSDFFIGDKVNDEKLSSVARAPAQSCSGYFLGGITFNSSGTADLYVAQVRDSLFQVVADVPYYSKPLSINLGTNLPGKVSVFASQTGGFYLLTNENGFNNNQNWLLTKTNNDGTLAWSLPIVFGGEGLDTCGSIQELPDGRLALIGTMRTGKPDVGELKMTFVKVNKDGKFEN